MENKSIDKESNKHDVSQLDAEMFNPIDLDWRKTYYKGFFKKRFYAFLLDLITTVPLAYIIAVVLLGIYIFVTDGGASYTNETLNFKEIFEFLMVFFFMFLPFGIMESSKLKGTFGKRIVKIEITDNYGNRITFWRSLWRNILKFLTLYSYFFIVPAFIQYFTYKKTKKLFHDKFSNTIIGERL